MSVFQKNLAIRHLWSLTTTCCCCILKLSSHLQGRKKPQHARVFTHHSLYKLVYKVSLWGAQNYKKQDVCPNMFWEVQTSVSQGNLFWPCLILLEFLILSQILCPGFYTFYPEPFLLTSSFWVSSLVSHFQMSSIPLHLIAFPCFFFCFFVACLFFVGAAAVMLIFHPLVLLM